MTEAVSCQNTKVYVDTHTTGTTATWTEIKELKTFPSIGKGTLSKIEATHLSSTMKEYIEDIPDVPGELDFTFNAMPKTATDSNLNLVMTTLDSETAYPFKIEIPKLGITVTIPMADWSWNLSSGAAGQVQELTISLAAKQAMTIAATTS